MSASKRCLLVTAAWLSGTSIAAAADAPAAVEPDEELEEVLVSGARAIRNPERILAWLNRLVGHFSWEGYVELGSDGAPGGRQVVTGASKCVSYGPAVHCAMQVNWPEVHGSNGEDLPGGVSTLAPAMAMYALDMNHLAVNSMQVDNRGMADSGQGYLRGNTLTTTTACVDLPGKCQRISRIDARRDGKLIQMQVDIERDGKRVVRYAFVLNRMETRP